MDYRSILFSVLWMGVCLAANVDVSMFTTKKPISSTLVPLSIHAPDQVETCTLDDVEGECVSTYLCDEENWIITDGNGLLDQRFGSQCSKSLEICCLVDKKRAPEEPITLKPLPLREGCGWHNKDGVGMKTLKLENETNFGEYPWMVGIIHYNASIPQFVGGGSLIHPSVVMTAAHVVSKLRPSDLVVRLGEWDTQTNVEIYPYQERKVASYEIHQDFNKGNLFYDIALLFLEKPAELAPHVGVVCLPPQAKTSAEAGTRCTATGWGKDKFGREGVFHVALKRVEVPIVDNYECEQLLKKTRLGKRYTLHTSFMCAGGEPGVDTCTGDGGSPLSCPIQDEEERLMQSGIVSWGIGCGGITPGVYVNVGRLRSWIDDKVAGKGYDPRVYTY